MRANRNQALCYFVVCRRKRLRSDAVGSQLVGCTRIFIERAAPPLKLASGGCHNKVAPPLSAVQFSLGRSLFLLASYFDQRCVREARVLER